MQVAATNPQALDPSGLDPAIVTREKDVLADKYRQQGKPENVIEKIVESGLKTFYKEVCLLEQAFIHDSGKSVAQALKEAEGKIGAPVKIAGFVRYALGEGIEKQESDFAAEVAAASGNRTLAKMVVSLHHQTARYWLYAMRGPDTSDGIAALNEHRALADAIASRSVERARAEVEPAEIVDEQGRQCDDLIVARAVLTALRIGYTELVRGGWLSELIAGNANSRRSSGVTVSSGTRPMPMRAARPPSAGQAVTVAKRADRAGPPAMKKTPSARKPRARRRRFA